ncbi:MAG: hypothetical protein CMF12_13165 [Idiomarina sp.]|uniref:hypothetical protein n=1 Tax=Idiomarina sp. TaxID=1874361 RepID=UPI000C5183D5|nr:hypothetical protein [Idiomarina sp.]MBT43460.1 hypothetical protein [Idiomarina sp.]
MKKPSIKQRKFITRYNIKLRKGKAKHSSSTATDRRSPSKVVRKDLLRKISKFQELGVNIELSKKRFLLIWLPEKINFSSQYEVTTAYIRAIRYFVENVQGENSCRISLKSIRFDHLRKASTSAALVLTSEISKWDDKVSNSLFPDLSKWSPEIIEQFNELGYFDLFVRAPELPQNKKISSVKLIRYIKGTCGDNDKPRQLKAGIHNILGKDIQKWKFLHSGLSEAITNVSHHAYPAPQFDNEPKNWYLTASFDENKRELKVSFYDQGVGIPRTLPSSTMREYISKYLRRLKIGQHDAIMIRAALAYGRTRTHEDDRGKGLQDMLNFIRQTGHGYLSIISSKGLCKVDVSGTTESTKTERFSNALPGTLIIWNVSIP